MSRLIPLSDLTRDRNYDLSGDVYDPTGEVAYGANNEKLGTVRGALTEEGGRIRYLIVDVGSWFTSKEVLVPVGLARFEQDAVYIDSLTKDQVRDLNQYTVGQDYNDDAQMADERVLRGTTMNASMDTTATTSRTVDRDNDAMFRTPDRLQLLEERLLVNKDRYQAGSVEVGKHLETRTENVNVTLSHDEVVIERHPLSEPRPVDGNVTLGNDSETIRVDLEAERANVQKQAYVTEEVEVGKRTETEQRTFSETVGKEVLDVTKTGEVTTQSADTLTNRQSRTEDMLEDTGTRGIDVNDTNRR
ncbi:PRC and DUF2382 domain-containing protein [Deinococcus sonorensis]|uniref:DUF2382 domain-containing protein n=2 Tax=Deinococcus sonorensis TaxID=309891 RepID=A0AAU7UEL1_9DEIO